jgi:hypothetical protein
LTVGEKKKQSSAELRFYISMSKEATVYPLNFDYSD